jgi:hypothetical protein
MKFTKALLLLSLFFLPIIGISQEAPPPNKAPASSKAQRKAAKQKWKEQRQIEREQKKAIKEHHKRLQTKSTLKRMNKNRMKGERMRDNKREFFLIRWFKYNRKKV